tara:strand:- start:192 stop:698 length:507 start_codon:yes stop_codon:yes gene_type:complete
MQLLQFIKTVYQNYFELACFMGSSIIILLAIFMDYYLGLDACPMCIMSRYAFGLIAFWSLIGFFFKNIAIVTRFFVIASGLGGIAITGKQVYLQNLSAEEISNLAASCGMPLSTQIDYFGLIGGIANAYKGGPTCAEENWRFIFNFAEWGLLFFIIISIATLVKIGKK